MLTDSSPSGAPWWEAWDQEGSWLAKRWSYLKPFKRRFGLVRGLKVARQLGPIEWRSKAPEVPLSVPGWHDPVMLRPGTTDTWVFRQQVLGQELELDLTPAPRRIIDGGANIGLASRVWAERWPDAKILAVELEPRNVEVLRRNAAVSPNIEVIHAGIWGSPGKIAVSDEITGECGYRVDAANPAGDIRAITIDEIADEHGWDTIDLVKLDIEGSEREVLKTAHRWLDRTCCVAIELHEKIAPGCEAAFDAAIDRSRWDVRTHGEYLVATRRA